MKIETKSKQLEVTFPSDRIYIVSIDIQARTFTVNREHPAKTILDVIGLRKFANELSQIAQLVQDELNKVHGYEFNEEVKNAKTETIKEIVESVNEETEEDKLRKIYFALYDQMDEPERSQAKANWNYYFSKYISPLTIYESIRYGFNWAKTNECKENEDYWFDMLRKYEDK